MNSLLFAKENGSSDNARGKVEMTSRVALESCEQKGHTQRYFVCGRGRGRSLS
jgi:hypothetical protein